MIDYATWCQIKDCRDRQHLNIAQIAAALKLHPQTVATWAKLDRYRPRQSSPRTSRLDPFKAQVVRLLESHPYSGQQIFQLLREQGFTGGRTIVADYVCKVRPRQREAFLKLSFAPGECAQVDWGEYGSVGVGSTRRRLSFFVMVLCYSRMMYLEFTLSQTMEHFLAAHAHAFAAFHGCPARIMIDNLKTGVLEHLYGCAPVFNPRYLDFARHCGFDIAACNVGKGNEKGRVENGVGYVKKNFLNGLDLSNFNAVNPAARIWLDTVANVRLHGETHRRPVDMLAEEQAKLRATNPATYDIARIASVRLSKQFRVTLESNRYSVPTQYGGARVTLKTTPDRVCIYHQDQLIARHIRSYDRHQDIEDPEHPKTLIGQRRNARQQRLMLRFLGLSPAAQHYYEGLEQKSLNARNHLAKIIALAEIYGDCATARAIEDGLAFQAFSSDYIANILEARARKLPEPGPLQLTRRHDLLDIELAEPDFSPYEIKDHETEDGNNEE
jgi:transposase